MYKNFKSTNSVVWVSIERLLMITFYTKSSFDFTLAKLNLILKKYFDQFTIKIGKNKKGKGGKNHSSKQIPKSKGAKYSDDDDGSKSSGEMNDLDKELLSLDRKKSSQRSTTKSPTRK